LTIHDKGVQLWGGEWETTPLARFQHLGNNFKFHSSSVNSFISGVRTVEFSPCENYLFTASPRYAENDNPNDPQCIIVWDVKTGKKLRGFPNGSIFKWSHDDKYFARLGNDAISIYETPSMNLLGNKSVKVPLIKVHQSYQKQIPYQHSGFLMVPDRTSHQLLCSGKQRQTSSSRFNANPCEKRNQTKKSLQRRRLQNVLAVKRRLFMRQSGPVKKKKKKKCFFYVFFFFLDT
jgi:uncharacterized protein with WD repeat